MNQIYKLVTGAKEIAEFQIDLLATDTVVLDIETDGLDTFTNKIRLVQFEVNNNIYIINLTAKQSDILFDYMINLIDANNKIVIMHNAKFDMKFIFHKTGILFHNVFDTFTAEIVLTNGIGTKYPALKDLVKLYCNVTLDKDVRLSFIDSPVITEEMLLYSAMDVKYLKEIRELQLGAAENLNIKQVIDLEMKLLPIVARMEYDGVLLDAEAWMKLYNENVRKARRYKKYIKDKVFSHTWDAVAGKSENCLQAMEYYSIPIKPKTQKRTKFLEELTDKTFMYNEIRRIFNIGSHLQLKASINLYGISVTGTGKLKLQPHSADNLVHAILSYKTHAKQASTFGENWLETINPVTGRIHPNWNQVGTDTGRWSSDHPNIQNIVKDPRFRKCFISRPGYLYITADYSQAEMRLMGAISGEPELIDAYEKGIDIHTKTASILYGIPVEEVTRKQRSRGKVINFSIIYGTSAYGIATNNRDIDEKEAEELLSKFFDGYPRLKEFLDYAGEKIWEKKIAKTPFGRIRFFENRTFFEDNRSLFSFMGSVKREGKSTIIQGCSADSLKMAMVDCYYTNPFGHDNFAFRKQIHDEVVVEVREDLVDDAVEFLKVSMEKFEQQYLGTIPAVVDYDIAGYWVKNE